MSSLVELFAEAVEIDERMRNLPHWPRPKFALPPDAPDPSGPILRRGIGPRLAARRIRKPVRGAMWNVGDGSKPWTADCFVDRRRHPLIRPPCSCSVFIKRTFKLCRQRRSRHLLHVCIMSAPQHDERVPKSQTRIRPFPEGLRLKKYQRSDFLDNLNSRQAPHYVTTLGEAWVGDSRQLLKKIENDSIDLVVTSPPYGLVKKKAYGNEAQEDYVRWFRPFARELYRVMKTTGSLVINIDSLVKSLCRPN